MTGSDSLNIARFGGLAICFLVSLTPYSTITMIVIGHVHFLLPYIYHSRDGKINTQYLLKCGFLLALILIWLLYSPNPRLIYYLIIGYSVLHFLFDERYMFSESNDYLGWMRLSPIWLLFFSFTLGLAIPSFSLSKAVDTGVFISLIALASYVLYSRLYGYKAYPSDYYLLTVYASLVCIFYLARFPIAAFQFLFFVHSVNWYIKYYLKLRNQPEKLSIYKKDVLICNLGMVIFFFLLTFGLGESGAQASRKIFSPELFYICGALHYLISFRAGDFYNWVPIRMRPVNP